MIPGCLHEGGVSFVGQFYLLVLFRSFLWTEVHVSGRREGLFVSRIYLKSAIAYIR